MKTGAPDISQPIRAPPRCFLHVNTELGTIKRLASAPFSVLGGAKIDLDRSTRVNVTMVAVLCGS